MKMNHEIPFFEGSTAIAYVEESIQSPDWIGRSDCIAKPAVIN